MAELKTKKTGQSVDAFLNGSASEKKRQDCFTILETLKQASGSEPEMWGDSIIGFGHYHYKYQSGRENDWFLVGFSPRKQNFTIYFSGGLEQLDDLLMNFGKHKIGKGCLYFKQVEEIDLSVLNEMIKRSIRLLTGEPG